MKIIKTKTKDGLSPTLRRYGIVGKSEESLLRALKVLGPLSVTEARSFARKEHIKALLDSGEMIILRERPRLYGLPEDRKAKNLY